MLERKLLLNIADTYRVPNSTEFWQQVTQKDDVLNQFLIIHSDEAPLAPGKDLKGIYHVRNGTLMNRL